MSSLPFLVVLDMCTALARLDLGIVRSFGCGVVCKKGCLDFPAWNFLILVGLSSKWAPRFRDFLGKDLTSDPHDTSGFRLIGLKSALKVYRLKQME